MTLPPSSAASLGGRLYTGQPDAGARCCAVDHIVFLADDCTGAKKTEPCNDALHRTDRGKRPAPVSAKPIHHRKNTKTRSADRHDHVRTYAERLFFASRSKPMIAPSRAAITRRISISKMPS